MPVNRRIFLKQSLFGALQLGVLAELYAQPTPAKGGFPRSTPEAQGIRSRAILDFVNAVDDTGLHSLMIVRNGSVVAEGWWAPYAPELRHTLYSLSKSFTATGIGLAAAEGRLTVADKVVSFFPDKLPATVSEHLANMRIKDLLTMSTGHASDVVGQFRAAGNDDWIRAFLAQPVTYPPGTHFVYNSGATYMLSAILQQLTGETLIAYLTPRLFGPLGITGMDWETDPNGICTGGWGLRVTTEDIARFGQLYLQEGNWNGKQLLPADWVKEASAAHIMQPGDEQARPASDWLQGYGYQFWRCRNNAYRGDGAYGQYCIVLPEHQLVIAITSETPDMQGVLNQVWKFLLPEGAAKLPGEKNAAKPLTQRLKTLSLPIPRALATSPLAAGITGRQYGMTANDLGIQTIALQLSGKQAVFSVTDAAGAHPIRTGINEWVSGDTDLAIEWLKLFPSPIPGNPRLQTRATGAWKDHQTFEMTIRFVDTAHYMRVTCRFEGETIRVGLLRSIAIISKEASAEKILEGKRVS